jgi:FtsP/CotA-like multicopper oxidase with cupredoxin domain
MRIFIVFSFISVISFGQITQEVWMQSRMNGVLQLDGGGSTQFWGYSEYTPPTPGSKIFLPGPLLRFNEGDSVRIHFLNNSPEDHTIHWHGLDVDMANDGVPHTSTPVHSDSIYTYTFKCTYAGTFNYHCHVMTSLHLAMGMYGLFVVDPDASRSRIYTNGPRYTKDYNWLASELNQAWNDNPISPGLFTLYEPTYFMLNGKSGTQLHDGESDITGTTNDSIAMRFGNMGYGLVRYIFPEKANAVIYMSDGRVIPSPIITDTVEVYSGERYSAVLYPTENFTENVIIEYVDLRTNQIVGTNNVSMIIQNANLEEKQKSKTMELYGNPVNDVFSLMVHDPEIEEISIINSIGKVIGKQKVFPGINVFQFTLNAGVYLLNDSKSGTSIRFVKY